MLNSFLYLTESNTGSLLTLTCQPLGSFLSRAQGRDVLEQVVCGWKVVIPGGLYRASEQVLFLKYR